MRFLPSSSPTRKKSTGTVKVFALARTCIIVVAREGKRRGTRLWRAFAPVSPLGRNRARRGVETARPSPDANACVSSLI